MEELMEVLGERDVRVLKTVVAQYIVAGEPVGSRMVAKIRTIFKAFEEKSHLINLLDQTMAAQGVQIIISPEAYFPEMQLSLVASAYGSHRSPLGSLGVIGPLRMDYGRLVPIVRYTASLVTDLLNKRQT